MDPNEIRRLVEQAQALVAQNRSAPEGFLLAYVAWEAFKFRVLIVGLTARGMTVDASRRYLKKVQVWKSQNYDGQFKTLFGSFPSNVRAVGKNFRDASRFENLRHSYVHGQRRTSPGLFRDAALNLVGIVESDWATPLAILLRASGVDVFTATDPLGRLTANKAFLDKKL